MVIERHNGVIESIGESVLWNILRRKSELNGNILRVTSHL